MSLRAFRVELDESVAFVRLHHRHHERPAGHRFSLGVGDSELRGVAMVGRPVAKGLDERTILEVNRCCTDGSRNACSWLYTAAARCAREMGYRAIITYTSVAEQGASLRACGWWPEVMSLRKDYSFASSRRERAHAKGKEAVQKVRWLWLTGCEPDAPFGSVEPSAVQLELAS